MRAFWIHNQRTKIWIPTAQSKLSPIPIDTFGSPLLSLITTATTISWISSSFLLLCLSCWLGLQWNGFRKAFMATARQLCTSKHSASSWPKITKSTAQLGLSSLMFTTRMILMLIFRFTLEVSTSTWIIVF